MNLHAGAELVLRSLHERMGVGEPSDRELLERYQIHQDEQAFELLVRRHGSMVMGVCQRIVKNVQDAEDVFQAVFLVLARRPASIRKKEAVGSWLFGVATRLAHKARCADKVRHQREHNTPARGSEADSPLPQTDVSWREALGILDEELHALSERYRAPLILCHLEGRTHNEAAVQLGWSLGTLRRRLTQGRQRLHARLLRRGLNLGAPLGAVGLLAESATARVSAALHARVVQVGPTGTGASTRAVVLAEHACTTASPGWFKLATASVLVAALGAGLAVYSALPTQQPIAPEPNQPMKAEEPEKPKEVETVMRLRATGFSQGGLVRHGAFSPDSKSLAFVDWKFDPQTGYVHVLHLRDLATGKDRWQSPPMGPNGPLAFSPDGKVLAAAAREQEVRLFDTATGKVLHHLPETREGFLGHHAILGLTFSPDGKHLAIVKYGTKQAGPGDIEIDKIIPLFDLWDVATGKIVRQSSGPNGRGYSLVGYRDGKLLAWERLGLSSNDRLVDLLTGQVLFNLGQRQRNVPYAILSPDGKTCACPATAYGDYSIRRWELATGKELPRLEGHNGSPVALAFSPDGKVLASASADSTVRLWDVKTHKQLSILRGHTDSLACVAFSPDGRTLASGSRDKTIRLWDVAEGKLLHHLTDHQGFIDSVFFSPDGTLLVSAATLINEKNEGIPEVIVWKLPAR